jgi:hypothetical protein
MHAHTQRRGKRERVEIEKEAAKENRKRETGKTQAEKNINIARNARAVYEIVRSLHTGPIRRSRALKRSLVYIHASDAFVLLYAERKRGCSFTTESRTRRRNIKKEKIS